MRRTGTTVSTVNTTITPLGAGATFTGGIEDIKLYGEITVNVAGAPANAPGTFIFEFSPDGINFDISVSRVLIGPSLIAQPLRNVLPFFRIKYVNGATPQTEFRLTTILHFDPAKPLSRYLDQDLDVNEPVEITRAVAAGKSPDGPFTNMPSSGEVTAQSTSTPLGGSASFNATGPITDAFGFTAVVVTIISDVPSVNMGVRFQWFADLAATRGLGESTFTYTAQPNQAHFQVPRQGRFFRMVYDNNSAAQTTFELVTTLLTGAPPSDVLSIADIIGPATLAQIVKANIVGQREDGDFANSELSNNNAQKVAIADRPSEIRGRVPFHIPIDNIALVTAPGTILHTVTVGKIFHLQSFSLKSLNDSPTNGHWTLTDAGTIKDSFVSSSRVAGAPAAASSSSPPLPEPITFATNIRLEEVTGVIDVSGFLNGYEEVP